MTTSKQEIQDHVDAFVSANGTKPTAAGWPEPLGKAAFHGLVGRVVKKILPESEADEAALTVQFLVSAGIACGRNPHFTVEATRHGLNEFVVVVGDTSKARKGTGYDRVQQPIQLADDTFGPRCVSGLSSGEGLIFEVRDQRTIRRKARKSEKDQADEDGFITEIEDAGVLDKRLLAFEGEFASVLAVLERSGSTLASKVRDAWDGRDLSTKVKNSPLMATCPHIGMVCHITEGELRRRLSATEIGSGFANRYLFACSRRSKSLPRGGQKIEWGQIGNELAAAIGSARQLGEIDLDFEAGELWDREYDHLSEGAPGLVGSVTSRAEAHVRRLATIFAVLDREREVRRAHLEAGLEVWRYCRDSAAYLFCHGTGDPVADQILDALRLAGDEALTRTQIRDLLGRNQTKERVQQALTVLIVHGLAQMDYEGRTETWRAR